MTGCGDQGCDHGWRRPSQAYVDNLFPIDRTMTSDQVQTALWHRDLYPPQNFVFPCPTCRPSQFTRWENGCFRPNHRSTKCDLCIEAMGERGASASDRSAT